MPKPDLDPIDRHIVAALQADGRLTNADLANRVGLSPSPCLRRVNRLEREGYIEGYRAMLRRDQIGIRLTIFVGVKIEGHANEKATVFEEAIVAFPRLSPATWCQETQIICLKSSCPIWTIIGVS